MKYPTTIALARCNNSSIYYQEEKNQKILGIFIYYRILKGIYILVNKYNMHNNNKGSYLNTVIAKLEEKASRYFVKKIE